MPDEKDYIVAFIDILGFSESIREYDSGKKPQLLNQIKKAVNSAGDFLSKQYLKPTSNFDNWKEHLKLQFFSDCLCVAIPSSFSTFDFLDNFVFISMYISIYQNLLMVKGFFSRGGISIGSYYSDNFIIFSGALLDSVEIEKSKAKYPRVVLSDKLVDKLKTTKSDIKEVLKRALVVDEDNNVFLNNFDIYSVTEFIIEDSIKKLSKKNKEIVNESIKTKAETDKYEIKQNEDFLKTVKKEIKTKLILHQGDWYGIFQKYLWLIQFFSWNIHENNKFKKFNYH